MTIVTSQSRILKLYEIRINDNLLLWPSLIFFQSFITDSKMECREIVDKVKESTETKSCQDCEYLAKEFEKNPGGKPKLNKKGLVIAAIVGGTGIGLS